MTKKQFWKDCDRNVGGLVRPPFEQDFGLQSLVIGVAEIKVTFIISSLLLFNGQTFHLFTALIQTKSLYKSY